MLFMQVELQYNLLKPRPMFINRD